MSPLVADILMAPVMAAVPDYGIAVNYADNFMVLAKRPADLVSIAKALRKCLYRHPAGPLGCKVPKRYQPGEAVEFLGYRLLVDKGKCTAAPTERNLRKFEKTFAKQLKRTKAHGVPKWLRTVRHHALRRYVQGWSSGFRQWPGAEHHCDHYLALLGPAP